MQWVKYLQSFHNVQITLDKKFTNIFLWFMPSPWLYIGRMWMINLLSMHFSVYVEPDGVSCIVVADCIQKL